MITGFTHATDENLCERVRTIRGALSNMVQLPSEQVLASTSGHKEGAPFGGFYFQRWLLKAIEAELASRGVNTTDLGFDWTTYLDTQQREHQ